MENRKFSLPITVVPNPRFPICLFLHHTHHGNIYATPTNSCRPERSLKRARIGLGDFIGGVWDDDEGDGDTSGEDEVKGAGEERCEGDCDDEDEKDREDVEDVEDIDDEMDGEGDTSRESFALNLRFGEGRRVSA